MSRLPPIPEEPGSSPPYRSTQLFLIGKLDQTIALVNEYLAMKNANKDDGNKLIELIKTHGVEIANEMKGKEDDSATIHSKECLKKCTSMIEEIYTKMHSIAGGKHRRRYTRQKRTHRKRIHRKRTHRKH